MEKGAVGKQNREGSCWLEGVTFLLEKGEACSYEKGVVCGIAEEVALDLEERAVCFLEEGTAGSL